MKFGLHVGIAGASLLVPSALVSIWVGGAAARLAEAKEAPTEKPAVATAAMADEGYCSADLKKVLRRVLQSCGLVAGGRGCQPLEAKNVAAMAGDDFNALFMPLADRAAILQFDKESAELDPGDLALLDATFADQRGGSYFFVVSRASPDGSAEFNRDLSQKRGDAVLSHLRQKFADPNNPTAFNGELDQQVGLLWLGEEVAQLDSQFCGWKRSGAMDAAAAPADGTASTAAPGEPAAAAPACAAEELNRSAFIAWIDCRL
jgi:outer membrane protein OmpA-like peptidoglycan-associated protein